MAYRSEESAAARVETLKQAGIWPAYRKILGQWVLSYDPPMSLVEMDAHGYLSLGADTMHDG